MIEYAIFQRSDGDYWQAIAGGGEEGETPEEAAKREIQEEAGIPKDCDIFLFKYLKTNFALKDQTLLSSPTSSLNSSKSLILSSFSSVFAQSI